MRIGAKLLVTHFIVLALVGLAALATLPRMVEETVRVFEQNRLQEMVEKQGVIIGRRISAGIRGQALRDIQAARTALKNVQEMLVEETLVFLDDQCTIVGSSKPELMNRQLKGCVAGVKRRNEIGDYIVAIAPLDVDHPLLKGYSLAMIRDMRDLQALARPMARRLNLVVMLGLLASLVAAGWLSRDLVKRLHSTGAAARDLAEGDLSRRAPEEGTDEITDLARHFNHMAERIQILVDGLRRSEAARKDLLITCSHELRTPMTSIAGFAEALRDGVVQGDEKRQRYYQIIATEAARLTRLINDLFDVAKLEAGQAELRLQAMPSAPWLMEFAEQFRGVAEEHQVRLELSITPEAEPVRIYGDRDRLDQVLTNLAGNAVRFSPPGETVALRARVDGPDLVVEVVDHGPGIPPDEAAHVFERFFQGRNKGYGHKGAGLGLAIVKSLVEAHGGSVGVQSTPGTGSTFWIRLGCLKA